MSYQVRNAVRAKAHTAGTPHWQVYRDTERAPVIAADCRQGDPLTLRALQAFCDVNSHQLDWADEYGEPGYGPAEKGILFANWNDIPKSLQTRLEAQGYELEWSDEWYVDTDRTPCKAWRTQADDMSWEPRLRAMDGYYITPDSDPQEWIDSSLNEQSEPLPSWFDETELTTRGFHCSKTGHDPGNRLRNVFKEFRDAGYDVLLGYKRSYECEVWTRKEAERGILFDSASGVYIPQRFAREIDRTRLEWKGTDDDWSILDNPDSELYWEVWQDVLDHAILTLDNGTKVRLEQDGDVFYIDVRAEFCEFNDTYYTSHE